MGFRSPNYTQVPNEMFDLMSTMGHAEFKVIMVAVRQTIGYHRQRDAISYTQFEAMTGLSPKVSRTGLKRPSPMIT